MTPVGPVQPLLPHAPSPRSLYLVHRQRPHTNGVALPDPSTWYGVNARYTANAIHQRCCPAWSLYHPNLRGRTLQFVGE